MLKILFLSMMGLSVSCVSVPGRKLPQVEAIGRLGFQKVSFDKGTYYYLPSQSPSDPLLIFVQGSGCNSVFSRETDGTYMSNLGNFASLKGRIAILSVEKPGVVPLTQSSVPGVAGCSDEFKNKFTFDLWVETLMAAADYVVGQYGLNPSKVIAMGHSEGSDVVALLASRLNIVTHTICMSGGGGSPLFDAILRALHQANGDKEKEDQYLRSQIDKWIEVNRKGDEGALLWGHTLRYWQSRSRFSVAQALNQARGKVMIVYGIDDKDSPAVSSDLLISQLGELGRPFEFRRIRGDHGYKYKGRSHLNEVLLSAIDWALNN